MVTKRKVLVVDDNIDFCENIIQILESNGYEAIGVHDGFKALETVENNGIDLVLMDVRMPTMDGVETFKKLKVISPEIPVIMITAHTENGRIREALRNGASGAFEKPLDIERLKCSMKKAIPNGAKIMIVDGNKKSSAGMMDLLSENKYQGIAVFDGNAAIQKAREISFDIIIMDMKLPDMNFLEVYNTICDIRPKAIVIIIMENREKMGAVEQSLQDNVYVCLEKPLDMDHLLRVIQDELKGRN
ncbi:MAG: response regulator [Candidatus Scalindua sp.]|nr:response regulator [Candidatus Scalindua sp.]